MRELPLFGVVSFNIAAHLGNSRLDTFAAKLALLHLFLSLCYHYKVQSRAWNQVTLERITSLDKALYDTIH